MSITFLTLDEVVHIHREQIELHGGSDGVRDIGLLESAIAMPAAGFGDEYLHKDIHEMAAAYLFHIVQNHPFIDGNGRTARMFTTLLLFQRGYDFKYLFELSHYYNQDRDQYYAALRTADATGDLTDWLVYFLGGFAYQMVQIKERARAGESEGRS